MKIAGFILAFYILFLGLEPGLRDISLPASQETAKCCEGSCEPIAESQPEKKSEDKNAGNKACNPFQFCKCCTGVNTNSILVSSETFCAVFKPKGTRKENIPPQVVLDFWQPPKIA
jgi:hypothetical protein